MNVHIFTHIWMSVILWYSVLTYWSLLFIVFHTCSAWVKSFQGVKFLLICTLKCQGSQLICPHMKWWYIKFFVLLNLCLTILCSTVYWRNRHLRRVCWLSEYIFLSLASLIREIEASCNTLPQLGLGVHITNFHKYVGSVLYSN
jgi:hypothetical protein